MRRNQKGQAMVEYVMLVILVSLVCIAMVKMLPRAVRGYVQPFYYVISKPVP